VRVLPEQVLVRSAVHQGIGRALRDFYGSERCDLLPKDIRELLEQLDRSAPPLDRPPSKASWASKRRIRPRSNKKGDR
jgi:hypothetical protein